MANNGSSAGTVLVAFALGAMAGAAVALLYAPGLGRGDAAQARREGARRAAKRPRRSRARAASSSSGSATTSPPAVERGREAFEQARKETL